MTPPDTTPDTPSAPASAPPTPAPVRWGRRLAVAAGGLLLAAVLAVAAGWQWLRSDSGTAWLLAQVPGLTASDVGGTPAGGALRIGQLRWQSGGAALEIDGMSWHDLQWRWRPYDGAWIGLRLDRLQADRVRWTSGPSTGAPLTAPSSLRLPVPIELADARLGTVVIDDLAPLTDLQVSLDLGAEGGRVHRVHRVAVTWDRVRLGASGQIAADSPLALQVEATGSSLPGAAAVWQADMRLAGPLARLEANARLRSSQPPAALDARATLLPFAAWPLAALEAGTTDLDLSALASGAPATRLSGRAVIDTSGADQPVRADVLLDNAAAGRWDEGRLPLTRLVATLRGDPKDLAVLDVPDFDLQLGGPTTPGGRVRGSGRWQQDRLALDLRIDDLRPQRLDRRAAALVASGPLTLSASGLPSPAPGATPPAAEPSVPVAREATVKATLSGLFEAGAGPLPRVNVAIDATARQQEPGWQVDVRTFDTTAGAARARLAGTVAQASAGAPLQVRSQGTLTGFDFRPWWPGAASAPWGQAAQRLDGRWDVDLALPRTVLVRPGLATLAGVRGRAAVTLGDSRLAGLPVEGALDLRQDAAGLRAEGRVAVAGNEVGLNARGRLDRDDAQGAFTLDAPALAALAPLSTLHPALSGLDGLTGSGRGTGQWQGRWPDVRSTGDLAVAGLAYGEERIEQARLQWNVAAPGAGDGPLNLTLDGTGLAHGEQRLDRVQAAVEGSWRNHRLRVDAGSPARLERVDAAADTAEPPRAKASGPAAAPGAATRRPASPAAAQAAAATAPGTRLQLRGSGSWQATVDAGDGLAGSWSGRVDELLLRPRGAPAAQPWLRVDPLQARVTLAPDGSPRSASADPGRVELLGASLRWSRLDWSAGQAGGAPQRIDVEAALDPLQVAPLLARLQPDFGWAGDLRLAGRLRLTGSDTIAAELLLERTEGDLQVTDGTIAQPLGLSDLRLALTVADGVWSLSQGLAGTHVGVIAGAAVVRTTPDRLLPPRDAPLDGVLELRVANLAVWSNWVPPGWRIGGSLRTSARFGGTLGAAEYTGEMAGTGLSVRNLLQGVDIHDGDLLMRLAGPQASIERFTARAGQGELRITGGADFGAQPRLRLQVDAQRFQALGRIDRRLITSGTATLNVQGGAVQLDGRVDVDEGLFDFSQSDAPSLDSDVVVLRPNGRPADDEDTSPATAPAGRKRNVNVNLVVDLGRALKLRGRGFDATLRGQVTVTTPGGRPSLAGTVRTVGGTYAAYGQALDIERGEITFTGPVEDPRLDILALRAKIDERVGVAVTGTAQNPRVRLFSEPEMSEVDKLSWLVMGRPSDGLGRTDLALLQRAALALLSGESESPADTLLKSVGIDELSVSQTDDGDARETVVTLGKQLSRRWYVGYERSMNATEGTLQLVYRVARRFTLRAQSGAENSIDVIWIWRWT